VPWCSLRARTAWRNSSEWPAARSERRGWVGIGEEAAAEVLLAPGLRGSARSGAVKVPRGLRRTETRQRREIAVAELLTGGNF
jgi:hypothetical protein